MAKKINYTPEQTTFVVDSYNSVREGSEAERRAMVEEIATELDKPVRSVIAKLSREGVYIAKETKSKVTGEKPMTKEELAEKLVTVSGLNLNTESVAKMNKLDISRLIGAFLPNED